MADGVRPDPAVGASLDFRARDTVIRREEVFHRLGDCRSRLAGDSVQLAAIAGGHDNHFFENPAAAQLACGVQSLLRSKRDALAKLDRSGAMIAAEQRDLNVAG